MLPETIFHLIGITMIGACVLGCIVAGIAELWANDDLGQLRRRSRKMQKRRMQHRAKLRIIR